MCVIWAVVVLMLSIPGIAPAARVPADVGEGCAAAARPCAYAAHQPGDVQGVGWGWHVEIVRHGKRIHIEPSPTLAGFDTTLIGAIQPGDEVRAWTVNSDVVTGAVFVGALGTPQ